MLRFHLENEPMLLPVRYPQGHLRRRGVRASSAFSLAACRGRRRYRGSSALAVRRCLRDSIPPVDGTSLEEPICKASPPIEFAVAEDRPPIETTAFADDLASPPESRD